MHIKIQTTQNVVIEYSLAGLGPRILASLVDSAILTIWILGVIFLLITLRLNDDLAVWLVVLLIAFPWIFYDLLFEYLNNGQSLGKKVLKIRVVNLDGTKPSFGSYLIRWLFRFVDFTLTSTGLAVLMVALSEKGQRLGDLLAGTTVINLKAQSNNDVLDISSLDFHDDYSVSYSNLLECLSDDDVRTIKSVLDDKRYYEDYSVLKFLADKIKDVTGYSYEGSDRVFLRKILDDYNYLSLQ